MKKLLIIICIHLMLCSLVDDAADDIASLGFEGRRNEMRLSFCRRAI